eukprot:TRINITY_DN5713_c0_g1_i3.p1 TRINITY_DN5713_c0_g1~~TRINITY_DN5713_c0_g1_i3.p1  ORF type:complete len:503 (+),score=104.66 TRINITY_DN5713_c0_g1_i3:250-1758(+)
MLLEKVKPLNLVCHNFSSNPRKWLPAHRRTPDEKKEKKRAAFREGIVFSVLLVLWMIWLIVVYSIWVSYKSWSDADYARYWFVTRDVSIMIFLGFGFLMTFMRRYGYSAVGYTLFFSSLSILWSIPLQFFFEEQAGHDWPSPRNRQHLGVYELLNGLFCSGAVMITFGGILGKVSPLQMLVISILEPAFYWINLYVCLIKLQAHDVGGGYTIHTFGCYFGLTVTFFLSDSAVHGNPDNTNSYTSDLFSLAGTLFLWIMWPSFNAAIALEGLPQTRAVVNTFIALLGSTIATFGVSRVVKHMKFDIVHVQNAVLAGGVVMGCAADLDLSPPVALGMGIIAGTVSTLGYTFLTPLLNNWANIQDVCGIHNLHGMPGVLGIILTIFATAHLARESPDDPLFPKGKNQAGFQTAALGVTLGLAIGFGALTGLILWALKWVHYLFPEEYFNDRTFWEFPTDYENVVREEQDDEMMEMQDPKHTNHMLSRTESKGYLKKDVENGKEDV